MAKSLGQVILGYLKDPIIETKEGLKFQCPRCHSFFSPFSVECHIEFHTSETEDSFGTFVGSAVSAFDDSQCSCGNCGYTDKLINMVDMS